MSGVQICGGFFQGFFVWLIRAKNVVVCFLSLLMPRANSKLPSPKTKMQNSLNDFRHTPYLKRLQTPQVYVCLWNMPETALRIE